MFQELFNQLGGKIASISGDRVDYGVDASSPHRKQVNAYFQHYRIQDLLPYVSFDPSSGLFQNKSGVGFVLETYPMVGCTEEMQREISGIFQHTLPEGGNLQVLLWADPRVGNILKAWQTPRQSQGEVLAALASRRVQYLRGQVFNSTTHQSVRTYRCIVAYSERGEASNPVAQDKLKSLMEQLTTALKTLGMPVKRWNADDLIQTLDGIININTAISPCDLKWNPYDSLDLQIPSTGTSYQIHKDRIAVNDGEFCIRTYTVRREPDQWSLHAMGDLIGDTMRDPLRINCPFIIHYGVHICEQESTKTRVQGREPWIEMQAHSKIGKRVPIIVSQARELDFLRHQLSKGERLVQTSFSVTIFSPKDQLSNNDQVLLNLFRSKRWQLQYDAHIQLQSFLSILPMSWGEGMNEDLQYFKRLKTTVSTESANLLPLQAEWHGTSSPGMLLLGRRGQLFQWSPFDNNEGNYNVCVVGRSGSGKSVFMQELMTSTLGQGGQVFVLDVGRSFEKTAKLLGGQFVEFRAKAPLCINPFSTIPIDDPEATSDALAMLKPIVGLMASPTDGTNDLENAYIEKALRAAWELKQKEASMTDVAGFLIKQEDRIASNLGQKLFPYTANGIYGRFFTGPATIDLTAKIVVVELEELKERKDLQSVVVQMVILQITNKLYLGDRKTPSMLVLDEAWDMLRGKQSGIFIETAARRFRKYFGSLVVGTQVVNDFYATPGAEAAFNNSDWMCLLSQKKESIDQLKRTERIALDPLMESLLTSVKTRQGEYAEVMIYGPHGYAIGRLCLDPFSKILYSTKAEEYSAVQELQKQGLSLAEAVEKIAEEKG
ncbi:MAG: type IV secretion system protein TraC [Alphaproteobacteria bacterium]|nr:type IV secretion system protein TraC [Alphaproteobacteria bacterium]